MGCEESFTLLIYKENGVKNTILGLKNNMEERIQYKEEQELDEGNEDTYLNLDLSILTDRNNSERKTSIADWNGIRIFDKVTEQRISEHQESEQGKINQYRKDVLGSDLSQNDKELEHIKKNVFALTAAPGKSPEAKKNSAVSWNSSGIILGAFLITLLIGFWYGGYTKKVREKRLADIDNRYEE